MLNSTTEIEVRYAETDQMGVVHHASYWVYVEQARVDWCSQIMKVPYTDWETKFQINLAVVGMEGKCRSSSTFGDHLLVKCTLDQVKNRKSVIFRYWVYKKSNLNKAIFTATTVIYQPIKMAI